jgi:hypothetical protein
MTTTDEDKLLADAEALNKQCMEAEKFERKQHEHRVDLKWSLWSANEGSWEDYAPDALAALKAGIDDGEMLKHGGYIRILTAPRKEIRSGEVCIFAHEGHIKTTVEFRQEWDEPRELACLLLNEAGVTDPPDEQHEKMVERLSDPWTDLGTIEVEHFDLGESPTLAEVLARIDDVEERLIANDKLAWESLVEWAKEEFGPQTTTKEN